jgi:spore germination protein GerM
VRRLLLTLVTGLLLTGCGVPTDDAPRPLDRDAAPFRVFDQEAVQPVRGDVQVQLYFVSGDRLVPVVREVPAPATAEQVARALFTGLTATERTEQLSSAIPTAVELVDVVVADRIAVVTLDGLNEQVQVLAYAQVVVTLDALETVDGVRFRTGDSDLRVPRGDGSLTEAPVNAESYAEQLGTARAPAAAVVPPAPVTPAPQDSPTG